MHVGIRMRNMDKFKLDGEKWRLLVGGSGFSLAVSVAYYKVYILALTTFRVTSMSL